MSAIADFVRPPLRRLYGQMFESVPRHCSEVRHIGDPAANEALAYAEYQAGKTVLSSLPPVVTYALTTYCYTGADICVICDRVTRPASADSSATEEAIAAVTPLLQTAMTVLLHCGGEAMFSPHFDRVIALIKPPTRVMFATNGMALTPRRAERMLERDIMTRIIVSLDAATPELFRIMRPACDLETISRNVSHYVKRARELKRDAAAIILNMTVCESNLVDVPKLVDLAVELGVAGVEYNHLNATQSHTVKTADGWDWVYAEQAQFKDPSLHDRLVLDAYRRAKTAGIRISFVGKPFIGPDKNSIAPAITAELSALAAQTLPGAVWQSSAHRPLAAGLPMCAKPWREVMIQPTGVVRGCYFHDEVKHNIGHLAKTDFMRIWNSDEVIRRREQFLTNGVSKVCLVSHPCMFRGRE
jgi:MoaA/NifB/PqqE/SkfB family radical SAM enzyme